MTDSVLLRKDQLEISLHNERNLIKSGKLKDDNPLDLSEGFKELCEACRRGDLKACQEKITEGVNINGRDLFDCTPLILASLCGHYEVVQLLLDSGALCERDTFQGERCLYNALNNRIRNLLLKYDYSKSSDPLQPYAAHIASLLSRDHPQTSDIIVTSADESFHLHKFILSARSPYFRNKLAKSPEVTTWKLPSTLPPQAFSAGIKYLYLGETPRELRCGPGTGFTEAEVLAGIDRIAIHLELPSLMDTVLDSGDRRLARQRRTDEVAKCRDQMEAWFQDNVLRHKMILNTGQVDEVKWDRNNGIFADVLLCADEDLIEDPDQNETRLDGSDNEACRGIPIGPTSQSFSISRAQASRKSVLYPAHRAMLLRSEFFLAMFSSGFREAQMSEYLQIIRVDCTPDVLEVVLDFLYTEKANIPLDMAVDVLYAADLLMIERLKTKAGVVISTLGNGNLKQEQLVLPEKIDFQKARISPGSTGEKWSEDEDEDKEPIDVYEIIRAGWLTRVQRLEEFAARYLAYRLEAHIDRPEFEQLVLESATRIEKRQETDSIELIDDIRYYLSDRFRLRFEDSGLHEMMEEGAENEAEVDTAKSNLDGRTSSSSLSGTPISSSSQGSKTPEEDEGIGVTVDPAPQFSKDGPIGPVIRTLDGAIAGDEFARDAVNYQILLNKLDRLLEKLDLDA
ncbi:hypothetical protein PRK78_006907 [Emydomyces testavorans]|uniref:BTB domain-containing protein n=1 Tax=Emydomyces testavorans TaxID=2070801 RepID=A0AAF0DPA6_9EURO|nr:hypothetical protein PRK78_006907 [Emydomyces testavorans]